MSRITENPQGVPRVKIRGFEIANGWSIDTRVPEQATAQSAGYDFFAADEMVLTPKSKMLQPQPTLVPTGIKAYMRPQEVLLLFNRSSNPKRGLVLSNGVGVVDADYYSNADNDGHICFSFWNENAFPYIIKKGDRIGQGIFINYLKADGGSTTKERRGGFGHTGI